jgi:ferredoxin
VIAINAQRCNGCGACVEICPTGAVYLVEGKAEVDSTLCHECEECLTACPTGAIGHTAKLEPTLKPAGVPALRSEPDVIQIRTQPALVPFRTQILPLVGAALTWAGREIAPRLMDRLLHTLDRETPEHQTKATPNTSATLSLDANAGGGHHRRRRRRGSG